VHKALGRGFVQSEVAEFSVPALWKIPSYDGSLRQHAVLASFNRVSVSGCPHQRLYPVVPRTGSAFNVACPPSHILFLVRLYRRNVKYPAGIQRLDHDHCGRGCRPITSPSHAAVYDYASSPSTSYFLFRPLVHTDVVPPPTLLRDRYRYETQNQPRRPSISGPHGRTKTCNSVAGIA
jgi:hypothetical protein